MQDRPTLCEDAPMDTETRTISLRIDAPAQRVYEFVRDAYNLPRWAGSFFRGVERDGDQWLIESTQGPAQLEYAPLNDEGVLDHTLSFADGTSIVNAMRVTAHGDGSELTFVLSRPSGSDNGQFAELAARLEASLGTLRTLVEERVAQATAASAVLAGNGPPVASAT